MIARALQDKEPSMQTSKPAWLSLALYPFEPRYFATPAGKMHYIDVGQGRPLVFVHGNPSWSFEFRALIRHFSADYRCIAIDHLGFGLSDKGTTGDGDPRDHAARLRALLEHLALDDITLVLADWGGPIGLDVAVAHPERVAGLVLFNTWAWPVNDDRHFVMFSSMMASRVGQFLIRHFNIFVNVVMPMAVGVKEVMTKEVMDHYRGPFGRAQDRGASAALPRYILAARPWLESIWRQREAFAGKPALVVWGGADIAFREKEYKVWKAALRNGTFHFYKNVGHMIAEEIPAVAAGHIRAFLAHSSAPAVDAFPGA